MLVYATFRKVAMDSINAGLVIQFKAAWVQNKGGLPTPKQPAIFLLLNQLPQVFNLMKMFFNLMKMSV